MNSPAQHRCREAKSSSQTSFYLGCPQKLPYTFPVGLPTSSNLMRISLTGVPTSLSFSWFQIQSSSQPWLPHAVRVNGVCSLFFHLRHLILDFSCLWEYLSSNFSEYIHLHSAKWVSFLFFPPWSHKTRKSNTLEGLTFLTVYIEVWMTHREWEAIKSEIRNHLPCLGWMKDHRWLWWDGCAASQVSAPKVVRLEKSSGHSSSKRTLELKVYYLNVHIFI